MKKENTLWKLDILETKFLGANPRYPRTKVLVNARHNEKLINKLPQTKELALNEIQALKSDLFEKKYYSGEKKLTREVTKVLKNDILKLTAKKSEDKKTQQQLENSKKVLEELLVSAVESKISKIITQTMLTSKQLKESPPDFISPTVREFLTNKTHKSNPSSFFKQNSTEINNCVSQLWNNKKIKEILTSIEWSFRIVRGDLTKKEKSDRTKQLGKDDIEEIGTDESASEDSESEDGESGDDSDVESKNNEGETDVNMDDDDVFEQSKEYDNLLAASSDEEQDDLDVNINYNEITDEEPSESSDEDIEEEGDSDDSFFKDSGDSKTKLKKTEAKKAEKKDKKEKKHILPELASGYFSGGSDSEGEDSDDEVVKEIVKPRKNRRGQRARQKIWEQKYGKTANHVKKEEEKVASEREQRRLDYEERVRKRALKAELAAPSGTNNQPLGERKVKVDIKDKPIHPSWEAKKLAEEKTKNVKFAGKKVTFD